MPEWPPPDAAELLVVLEAAAADLDVPDAADLPARVRARLAVAGPARRPAPAGRPRLGLVAAAVAAVVAAVALATPSTREAVADWLGIGAVEIRYGEGPPAATVSRLRLGDRVALDRASARAGFAVRRPRALGEPAAAYVRPLGGGAREVTLVWPPDDGLPRTAATGVGLLLTEVRGGLHPVYLKKLLGAGVRLEEVTVAGAPGYWISGEPHILAYLTPEGREVASDTRLAGNVLVWTRGGVTYRIESALDRASALRIAASIR